MDSSRFEPDPLHRRLKGRGIGPLQKVILKEIGRKKRMVAPTRQAIYLNVQETYWGDVIRSDEDYKGYRRKLTPEQKAELNRRRASIGQALAALKIRGLVAYNNMMPGCLYVTTVGKEVLANIK